VSLYYKSDRQLRNLRIALRMFITFSDSAIPLPSTPSPYSIVLLLSCLLVSNVAHTEFGILDGWSASPCSIPHLPWLP
jgi:hypothetical protein